MIKAVVFDVGGTLHTSQTSTAKQEDFSRQALKILSDAGIHLPVAAEEFYGPLSLRTEEYKTYSERSGRELPTLDIWADYFLRPFHVDRDKLKPISEELSFLYDYARVLLTPRHHMKETILKLQSQGLKTGIISNIISLTFVPRILKEYEIEDLMSCVVTSSEAGVRKPDAGIFRLAEKSLGLTPLELAYVGDTISRDVLGVRNAGWRLMIQIDNPRIAFRDRHVVDQGYTPDYLISSLEEIPLIIQKENSHSNQ